MANVYRARQAHVNRESWGRSRERLFLIRVASDSGEYGSVPLIGFHMWVHRVSPTVCQTLRFLAVIAMCWVGHAGLPGFHIGSEFGAFGGEMRACCLSWP